MSFAALRPASSATSFFLPLPDFFFVLPALQCFFP